MASTLTVDNIEGATTSDKIHIPGHVVQVVSAIKTDKQTVTSTSFVDITDLSVSITPTSSTSKVLIILDGHGGHDNVNYMLWNIVRGSTAIAQPAGSNPYPASANSYTGDSVSSNQAIQKYSMTFLDSQTTTNATTYKIQTRTTSGTATVNGRPGNTNGATVSTITVLEIAQ